MEPKITEYRALKIVGLGKMFNQETRVNIPDLWGQFLPRQSEIKGTVASEGFGVCIPAAEAGAFEYVVGMDVGDASDVPEGMVVREIPTHRYAVFRHNVSSPNLHEDLQPTLDHIWGTWMESGGQTYAEAPDFELYPADFDPGDPNAWLDIYVPIK